MGTLTLPLLAAFAIGYVFGSIPFGLILTRMAGLGDVRDIGSGNIGATNVLRTGNKGIAAATLVLDAAKATIAVTAVVMLLPVISELGPRGFGRVTLWQSLPWSAALGALCGHIYPVWLGFKGGKGVAPYIGALLGVHWPAAIVFVVTWIIVAAVSRLSSLSALIGLAAVFCFFIWKGTTPASFAAVALMTALVFYKHKPNILRLLRGEEPKIGAGA